MLQDQITKKTIELRDYAGTLDRNRFIPFFIFLLRSDIESKDTYLQLSSKVQQILYLLRLFLNEKNGNQKDIDFPKVQNFLETIEKLYKEKFADNQTIQYYDNNYKRSLSISGTYLNYFLNSSLVYVEQIIDRINGTFRRLSSTILQETGLFVDDYIQFYVETNEINKNKLQHCYNNFHSQEINKTQDGITCYSEKSELFLPYSLPLELAIFKSDYNLIEIDKLDKLLSFFSSYPGDCNSIYYCYPNILQ